MGIRKKVGLVPGYCIVVTDTRDEKHQAKLAATTVNDSNSIATALL
jgi:hypothetical protein